jgi:integrase
LQLNCGFAGEGHETHEFGDGRVPGGAAWLAALRGATALQNTSEVIWHHQCSDRSARGHGKRTLKAAGRSPRDYSGHSLRAGLVTQAAMSGVSERKIQEQSGHKSLTVMRRYIRDGSQFRDNAAGKVGL